ncbi:heme-binding protein [Methylomonas montana]|uniref:GlcG/HbpS family heme-binding protein n=1 Tax=Methylomonas montana TaxID=3058963 RepID=UPI002659D090|nr:heme-binding protein [Methylomonas montana]WKJ92418.1 heme-binding protein [Methylomonas montana]
MNKKLLFFASILALTTANVAFADRDDRHGSDDNLDNACPVGHAALESAIKSAQAQANGGLGFHMWASVVNANGVVCAVAKSGNGLNAQWLGSRVISAQKAYTANAFSLTDGANPTAGALDGLALSTANLYSAVQPGGSLFGLQHSNPVDTSWAYAGNSKKFGRADDPMTGRRVGGVNVFGGGLALYNESGKLVGAVGVSGDTSCADHNIAWRVRDTLKLDFVPSGLSGVAGDNIIFDLDKPKADQSGFGHPKCLGDEDVKNASLILTAPIGSNP